MKRLLFTLFACISLTIVCKGRDLYPPDPAQKPPVFTPTLVATSLDDLPPPEDVGEVFFVDESLDQVLSFLGDITGKKILAADSLPKPVFNFDSQGEISKQEAITVIESLLSMNGVAIAEMGDKFLRVIPSGSLKNKAPDMLNSSVENLTPSEKMYSKLFKVKYMKWEDATQLVNNRLSPNGGGVELYESSKSFIITDTLVNIQRIEQLLKKLDIPSDKEIMVRKLKHILAADLKTKLETTIKESLNGFVEGSVTIQADERTNQIIIATDEVNLDVLGKLVQTYDVDTDPITSSKVISIKNAEATAVVSLLQTIISSRKGDSNKPPPTMDSGGEAPIASVATLQNGQSEEIEGKLQFSEYLSLVADERSNAVVVYGTQRDIDFVTNLIADIDVLLPQVKIDVVIAEVTLTDEDSRGIESFGISYDENDEVRFNINEGSDVGWNLEGSLEDIFLHSWTVTGFTMASVFDTAKRDSNVTVLSAPTLVTTHNREAVINAGESRPVITSSNTDSTGLNTRSQVQFKDIGIQLKVKPLIGSNGVVQMEIEQVVESVVDEVLIDGNSQPVIGKRQATSFVSVSSGQMIILGGLQENSVREVGGKMALLGDIPFIGPRLFTSKRKKNTRRELVIFIKPTVYFGNEDAAADLEKRFGQNSEVMNEMLDSYRQKDSGETPKAEETSEKPDDQESLVPLQIRRRRHL